MVVTEGPGGIKTQVIATEHPVVEGTDFGTTKRSNEDPFLIIQEESLVASKDKIGFT